MIDLHIRPYRLLGFALLLFTFFVASSYSMADTVDEIVEQRPAPKTVDLPGLICFWTFKSPEANCDGQEDHTAIHSVNTKERLSVFKTVSGGHTVLKLLQRNG